MKKLFFVLPLLFLPGCKFFCQADKVLSSGLSNAVISQWSCENPDQVKKDIQGFLDSLGSCPANTQGVTSKESAVVGGFGSLVCDAAANYLIGLGKGKVPITWQCDPTKVGANAQAGLYALCAIIPF